MIESALPVSAGLQIRLFGGVDLQSNGLPLRRTRSRTETWLLAALLLSANRNIERSWLAGIFWPESRQAQALNNLRRSLSNLRQALGEEAYRLLTPTRHAVAFDLAGAFCDVVAFDSALARRDAASLRQAVGLYRGPLLPGCDADWLLPERRSREQSFLAALETLAEQAIQAGNTPEAVRFLRQILHIEPLREPLHRALLEALASLGDKAGLTLAYRQLRLLLHDALRTEPSVETKALYQRLQEGLSRPGQSASFLPDRPAAVPSSLSPLRIPFPVSELVGRERETQEVASLIAEHRLLTLTGSGGIGKTRLALAVAARTASDFAEGVWFVDLSPLTDPTQVLPTVARALEVREQPGRRRALIDALQEHLQGRKLLLLLDNAESVLESCAAQTTLLLERLPQLRALVTSRIPLGVAGERVWRVPSLSFLDLSMHSRGESAPLAGSLADALLEYAGPRLFVTRALSASSAFLLTERNAPAILKICARLDGIPLALELAAARTASLSAEQIAARLEDAFRLLTTGARTAPPRHQTLRALVDWSYDSLSEPERILLERLSAFVGGWTVEAAEAVCGFAPLQDADVLDLLTRLVDKSLLLAWEAEGAMRYRMLETLRQYGASKLNARGETDRVQRRRRDYFVALTEEADPYLEGPEAGAWLLRLETEHDNLRAVLDECLAESEDVLDVRAKEEAGVRLAGALHRFWQNRGYFSEGREWIARILERSPVGMPAPRARAKALLGAGSLAYWQSDYTASRSLYEESLACMREIGDRHGMAILLSYLGNVASAQGDYAAARSLQEEGLALCRGIGDRHATVTALINLGSVTHAQGDYAAARRLYNESLALCRDLGDRQGGAQSYNNLGMIALEQGDYTTARSQFEESLALKRAIGDRRGIANTLINLGRVAKAQGDYAAARRLYNESLALCRDLGLKYYIAYCFEGLAAVCMGEMDAPKAVALFGAASHLRERLGAPATQTEQAECDRELGKARSILLSAGDDQEWSALWKRGCAFSMEEAIGYALTNAAPPDSPR